MSDNKHTPGPWTTHQDGVRAINGEQIATVHSVDADEGKRYGMGQSDNNARLIAAAPELLEALKGLLADCERPHGSKSTFNREDARAAITKAEGK